MTNQTILDCGHAPSPADFTDALQRFTTGYSKDDEGRTFCYVCCAERDLEAMRETGRATLYLIQPGTHPHACAEVTNWPGSLRRPVYSVRRSRHNIARWRYDFDFLVDGIWWHGVQYGDNTQIAHCKRSKRKAA